MTHDELMDEVPNLSSELLKIESTGDYEYSVKFQFDEDEPIHGFTTKEPKISIVLEYTDTNDSLLVFQDGKGKTFKLFLQKTENGIS